MADQTITLSPGTYYVGVDRPWWLSQSRVRDELQKHPIARVTFNDRDGQPPPVDPRTDPTYSDDWDEWISAVYNGPETTLEARRVWAWMVRVPRGVALPPRPPEEPSPSSPSTPRRRRVESGRREYSGAGLALLVVPLSAMALYLMRQRRG